MAIAVQAIQNLAPLCQSLNQDTTLRTMLSLFMPQLRLDSQAIKLQVNAGAVKPHFLTAAVLIQDDQH